VVTKTVGVLALQGNFAMHAQAMAKTGAKVMLVKKPEELNDLDGLILPGGESTTMLKHFELNPSWWDALNAFHASGKAIFGTCAGLILLANTVAPAQKSLGFLDVEVSRNAYGRQVESHNIAVKFQLGEKISCIDLPFIRAPRIIQVGKNAQAMGWVGDEVVMVQQDQVLGAACHPEAVTSLVHQYFLTLC